tara:strand:+ start:550 stop:1122 length:573 start_codon:yes stop_codon:yes gene_type:complete
MKFKIILILVLFLSTYSIVSIINNYNKINYKAISQTNKPINNNLSNKKNKKLELQWDIPNGWNEIEGNDFSLAVYELKILDNSAKISITEFPGDAGGIENNVNRWRRQVGLPDQKLSTINQNTKYDVNKLGRYEIHHIINNDNPDLGFLCMIQKLDSSTIFVKMQSTLNGIKQLENIFNDFCFSFSYVNT